MEFVSPSEGRLDFEETYRSIVNFVNQAPDQVHRLIVGTDSQAKEKEICYVTALVIYREGKGGKFYYLKEIEYLRRSMRQRVFFETAKSLEIASLLTSRLSKDAALLEHVHVEIHLDVGQKGRTQELIKEVVGMVTGSGYDARIKPDSYGASKVADKYTK